MFTTIVFLIITSLGIQRPSLTFAQAYVESGADIHAKGKAGERGAFQVIPKEWGRVPKTYIKQIKQNEQIIDSLIEEHGCMRLAYQRYNGFGSKSKRYVSKVFTKALEIELIGV